MLKKGKILKKTVHTKKIEFAKVLHKKTKVLHMKSTAVLRMNSTVVLRMKSIVVLRMKSTVVLRMKSMVVRKMFLEVCILILADRIST